MIEIKQEPANSGRFKLINNLNRTPNERQINILVDSMKRLDLSIYKPVMVYKDEIIDGQHRFLARERMGEPTYYVDMATLTDDQVFTAIHLLNSNAKNWTSMDYINLYSRMAKNNRDYLDYELLEIFVRGLKLSPSIAIFFLSDFKIYKSAINEDFKDGKYRVLYPENFKLVNTEDPSKEVSQELYWKSYIEERKAIVESARIYAEMYCEVRKDILEFYPKNQKTRFVKSPNFIFAFCSLASDENYNHDSFLVALKNDILKDTPSLTHSDSPSKYYEQLAKIHNSRSRNKVSTEYKPNKDVQDTEEQEE